MPKDLAKTNELSMGGNRKALPLEKVTWKLPKALLLNLTQYKKAFKALYNVNVEEDMLIELIR